MAHQRLSYLLAVLLVAALAGCNSSKEKKATALPRPATPTVPPVITRIVTPLPTSTPLPTPTLPYDLVPVAGRWLVRFEIQVSNAGFAERITYNGVADLQISLEGTVQGRGQFSPSISDARCEARVTADNPLKFTVQGTTRPQAGQIWADIVITPDDPRLKEGYALTCPDQFNDVRAFNQPVLWPILTLVNRLNWSIALQNNLPIVFESDLAQDTNGEWAGRLYGEIRVDRQ
jgi:hypothetical protein